MNGFPETQTAETFKRDEYRLPDRGQQVPDRLRPAAPAHDVRGQEARRGQCRADPFAPEPLPIPAKTKPWCWTSPTRPTRSRRRSSPTTTGPLLTEGTDPNLLYDLQHELADFPLLQRRTTWRLRRDLLQPEGHPGQAACCSWPRSWTATRQRKRTNKRIPRSSDRLRAALRVPFPDHHLHRCRPGEALRLRPALAEASRAGQDELPVEIQQNIDMDSYRHSQNLGRRIELERGTGELEPIPKGRISFTSRTGGFVADHPGAEPAVRHGFHRRGQGIHRAAGRQTGA